ncbi:MAG: phosphoglucomutase/phosphomannomutase family protein [Firmicutes bacterium]|nr:phosphoglucomutase/phosphomannomutase family protein [Bacillota bacterium]
MITFGTGGWREIIGDGFTRANVQRLMTAMARRMQEEDVARRGFCIGYDRRFLSREAAQWAAEVLAFHRIHTYLIKRPAPTPLVMFTIMEYGLPYGMAVTASHNPALYNGIKVFTKDGCDAPESVTDALSALCEKISPDEVRSIPYEQAIANGFVEEINPNNRYIDSIIRAMNMDAVRSRNLQIVLDPMYGVSRTSLQTILLTARCDVEVIHERHDALFGGRLPAPSEQTLGALRAAVLESQADLGIATDGDADRLGIIDDAGRFVHPNEVLVLLYYYLLKYKHWRGPAVRNISTTHLLDKVAEAFSEKCHETPVGFKHISAAIDRHNAVIGGESSGGLTVRGHIHGKDGIYAAALLVEMMAVTGRSLSELYREITDQFGGCEMVENNFAFDPARREALTKLLMEDKKLPDFGTPPERVSYWDGCKVYFPNGWVVVRFSGTEPLLRIFCEMPTALEARQICKTLEAFLSL